MEQDSRPPDPISGDSRSRRRALSFGSNAELYDRTRPTYPAALVEAILAGDPGEILDVGCGTGRAALLLAAPGRHILGIEPDPKMAAVAASHGIEVELGSFETWDSRGRRFDLLISGQAWHWVDPVAGAARAAEVLRSGGRFAAFWNGMHHVPEVRAAFAVAYGRYAPALLESSVALGVDATVGRRSTTAAAALAAGPFRDVTRDREISYEWRTDYTPAAWIGLLRTHSDHAILPPATREALLTDLEERLAALGATFPVNMRTDLLSAIRI